MKPVNNEDFFETSQSGPIGRDPRTLEISALNNGGFFQQSLLKVIREKCLDCCGGSASEVRKCVCVSCPLWPYRMNKNPFRRRDMAPAQKRQAVERMREARTN